jgi:adenine/guanine phosphoribosyltransferase-like PRPP-binding protein
MSDIEKELKLLLDEFRDLIKNRVLYNMDTTLNKQEYVVDYILSKYQKAIEQYKIKSIISTPKITTLFDKYKQNNIDTISGFDIERLKQFLKLNKKNLEKLFKLKEDRVLLVDDYKQYIIHHPQKKPKQKSQNEFRNQIRIIK